MRISRPTWTFLALLLTPLPSGCNDANQAQPAAQSQTPAPKQPARTKMDVSKLGPQVGERVPDFNLKDQSGKTWTLQSIMGPKGAMLVFFRSADW